MPRKPRVAETSLSFQSSHVACPIRSSSNLGSWQAGYSSGTRLPHGPPVAPSPDTYDTRCINHSAVLAQNTLCIDWTSWAGFWATFHRGFCSLHRGERLVGGGWGACPSLAQVLGRNSRVDPETLCESRDKNGGGRQFVSGVKEGSPDRD